MSYFFKKQIEYTLITSITILFFTQVYGQPEPCGSEPDMTTTCIEACVICDIDGYTGINSDTETGEAPNDFCTTTVHHMQWIAFIAGSTDLTLTVTTSNCQTNWGLEVGIYESLDCENFNRVSNCNGDIGPGQTATFSNTETLVIGQYYYFVMDGNHGDICNYTINVIEGSTMVPPLPEVEQVNGVSEICQNESAIFSIPEITGANFVQWFIDGELSNEGYETEITFDEIGTHELCVMAYNVCDTINPVCTTVEVYGPQTTNLEIELCEGDCYEVGDSVFCTPGAYSVMLSSIHSCDSIVNVQITPIPASSRELEATICSTDSLYVGNNWFTPGEYTEVTVAENGCDSIISLTIHAIDCEINGNIIGHPTICYGESSGVIDFELNSGTPPFMYSWEKLGGSLSGNGSISDLYIQESITDLPIGTYLITVNDSYGNDAVLTTVIEEPFPLMISFTQSDYFGYNISCYNANDGEIIAEASGGTGDYSYSWNTGAMSQTINALEAGDYNVNITDSNGCTLGAQTTLSAPEPIVFSAQFIDPGCDGNNTGQVSILSIEGGVSPYLAALSDDVFYDQDQFTDLSEGDYTLSVMDVNGCISDTSASLTAAIIPQLEVGEEIYINLGNTAHIQPVVDIIPESSVWSPSEGLSCALCVDTEASPLGSTVYTLSVSSEDGCITTDSLLIRVLKYRNIYAPNVFSPNDDGINDNFTLYTDEAPVRQIKSMKIFSRWGEMVFEQSNFPANEPYYGWDGTFLGSEMQLGVFTWMAEVEFIDGQIVTTQGDVLVFK